MQTLTRKRCAKERREKSEREEEEEEKKDKKERKLFIDRAEREIILTNSISERYIYIIYRYYVIYM